MPFLPLVYASLRQLRGIDWTWMVTEGVAAPVGDTKWVAPISPRLSLDGTTDWLRGVAAMDPRVRHIGNPVWPGKRAALNRGLREFGVKEEFVLFQMDADEVWRPEQIERAFMLLSSRKEINSLRFFCRLFLGHDIVVSSRRGFGNNTSYEWFRAWRVPHNVLWETHEPPKLAVFEERVMRQEETEGLGLVFDHFSLATKQQVQWKALYYGSSNNPKHKLYVNAVQGWDRLQANKQWPVRNLSIFLPFVGPGVVADKIKL